MALDYWIGSLTHRRKTGQFPVAVWSTANLYAQFNTPQDVRNWIPQTNPAAQVHLQSTLQSSLNRANDFWIVIESNGTSWIQTYSVADMTRVRTLFPLVKPSFVTELRQRLFAELKTVDNRLRK